MGGMAHPIDSRFRGLCQLELNGGSNVVEIYSNIACDLRRGSAALVLVEDIEVTNKEEGKT